jgi:four helix bundle protein
MAVRSYRELVARQKAMDLVESVYKTTSHCPKEELYALSLQLKRASVSVASNIAEGQGRKGTREFLHHLSIAYGSLVETETQLMIGYRLHFMSESQLNSLLQQTEEVCRLINGLSNALRERLASKDI